MIFFMYILYTNFNKTIHFTQTIISFEDYFYKKYTLIFHFVLKSKWGYLYEYFWRKPQSIS